MDITNFILNLRLKKKCNCEKLYLNIIKKYKKFDNLDVNKYKKKYKFDLYEILELEQYIIDNLTEKNKIDIETFYDELNDVKKCDYVLNDIIEDNKYINNKYNDKWNCNNYIDYNDEWHNYYNWYNCYNWVNWNNWVNWYNWVDKKLIYTKKSSPLNKLKYIFSIKKNVLYRIYMLQSIIFFKNIFTNIFTNIFKNIKNIIFLQII